jgi:hypothetical protein
LWSAFLKVFSTALPLKEAEPIAAALNEDLIGTNRDSERYQVRYMPELSHAAGIIQAR